MLSILFCTLIHTSSALHDFTQMSKAEIVSHIKHGLLSDKFNPESATPSNASLGEYGVCGGSQVLYQSYPQIASIRRPSIEQEFRHCCGATVISIDPPVLLTAAHCEACRGPIDEPPAFVYIGCQNPNVCLPNQVSIFRYNFRPENFIIMPGYNTPTFNNDVAVIILDEPISGPAALMEAGPVSLVNVNELPANGAAINIVGYGLSNGNNNELPHSLLAGGSNYVETVSGPFRNTCGDLPFGHPSITASMFCSQDLGTGQVSSCSGDSGGPWFNVVTGKQAAVTSWGYTGCSNDCNCCTQYASVAANIADPAVHSFICNNANGASIDGC